MILRSIPLVSLLAILDYQGNNPEKYEGVDADKQIGPDTTTRWAVGKDGTVTVATTSDAFPDEDGTVERTEVIALGRNNIDGNKYFLATAQDAAYTLLDDAQAQLEAQAFDQYLPSQGAHFGTLAHADTTFPTTGILYAIDGDGKLMVKLKIEGMQKAFYAGNNAIAIETAARFAIVPIPTFIDRVNNGLDLLNDDEGMAKEEGMTLVRAVLDDDKPVMAMKSGDTVAYFDQDGNKLEDKGETGLGENVYAFPAVDGSGFQKGDELVRFARAGDAEGTMDRLPLVATGK